jgi:tetratricopeptide (TPR) repeat protein
LLSKLTVATSSIDEAFRQALEVCDWAGDLADMPNPDLKELPMRLHESTRNVLAAIVGLMVMTSIACNQSIGSGRSAAASHDKVPITTKSEDARKEFLQGRDLAGRLLGQESLQHFDKAIALDPDFATAELARAANSPTAKEFFEHLNKAVNLADKSSEGEKLLILANQAGTNGEVTKQKDYLEKLMAAYPNDERVHLNLGVYHFGQQEFPEAIAELKKATEIAPNHSPAYNMLGYSYRQTGDYAGAEQAFKKYVELIPNDPNPYDSYAELLLKMGRFDDSIAQYRKALAIDTHFVPSHFGISADLTYLGKPQEAEAELQKMADQARNDGELRTAYFGMAVVASDGGKFDKALQAMDKQYSVAEKKNDVAAMSADLLAKGNISLEAQKYDVANRQFERSLQLVDGSSLSQEIKDNAKLLHHYNLTAVAIGKKDYAAAKTHAEEFRQGAEASKNPVQIKLAHELAGRIALAEKSYDAAIAELEQANQQDPRNLYRLSQAYQAKGDSTKAQDFCKKAANSNSLPALNYAFIRTKAQKEAAGKKA